MSHDACCKVTWYMLKFHVVYGHFSVVISTQNTEMMPYTFIGITAYV